MKHRLKTTAGKALYALRKVTSEPVFGIIKEVMGFRNFLLQGKDAAEGEWSLVCMAYNIKRMHVLAGQVEKERLWPKNKGNLLRKPQKMECLSLNTKGAES